MYPIWIIFLFEWLRIYVFFSSLFHFILISHLRVSGFSFLQFKSHSEFLWIHWNEVKHSGMTLIVFAFFLNSPDCHWNCFFFVSRFEFLSFEQFDRLKLISCKMKKLLNEIVDTFHFTLFLWLKLWALMSVYFSFKFQLINPSNSRP